MTCSLAANERLRSFRSTNIIPSNGKRTGLSRYLSKTDFTVVNTRTVLGLATVLVTYNRYP